MSEKVHSFRFCADVHLGKLARLLRMLGIDTAYRNDYTRQEFIEVAKSGQRILLSKDRSFAKLPEIEFFQINSSDSFKQLKQVIEHYQLTPLFAPFTRCLYCNCLLDKKDKKEIVSRLLPKTIRHFDEFWQCPCCGRLYWKGSHYDRMLKVIEQLNK